MAMDGTHGVPCWPQPPSPCSVWPTWDTQQAFVGEWERGGGAELLPWWLLERGVMKSAFECWLFSLHPITVLRLCG